jgi:hypothetical protein
MCAGWRCLIVHSWVAVMALAASARAEPPARTYSQAMADGARQMAGKDTRAAVASFQAALAARLDDPRALSELSWAQLVSGDFDAAAQAADRAIYQSRDPQLLAMAYYNLGRAEEARGAPVEAELAYAASLNRRDNPEVRARLDQLAPALLALHRLAGPLSRPEDFCKPRCKVEREAGSRWSGAAGLDAPFLDAVKLDVEDPAEGYPVVSIAVKLADGWYVLPAIGWAAGGHGGQHSADVRMVDGRMVVDWNASVGRFGHTDVSATYVCGLAGTQPSCVGPLVSHQARNINHCAQDPDCRIRDINRVTFSCRIAVHGDVVELGRDPAKIKTFEFEDNELPRADICDALPIAGKHALKF